MREKPAPCFPPHDQPAEQQHCREHRERSADGERLADVMPSVNEPDANCHDDSANDPGGHLDDCGPASVDRWVQMIENSKQKQ